MSCYEFKKSITNEGNSMWLVTTLIAAIIVTLIWYIKPKIYKLEILGLMLWGTSIMILVDHILGYEGGAFVEMETDGLITNGALLGIVMLIPIVVLWGIIMLTKKQKIKIVGE
jgi:ABC-type transport system involved in multi-copper enzyme maturation permease subunit